MAEINLSSQNKSGSKTKPPHIDLTPMVDLGFLLITFFMFTTTLMEKKSIEINGPVPDSAPHEIPLESTVTIIPAKEKTFYYFGILEDESGLKQCMHDGIRDIIRIKRSEVKNLPASFSAEAHKLHVLIKPADDCPYDEVISLLDEMTINEVFYYTMMDMTAEEKTLLTERLQ